MEINYVCSLGTNCHSSSILKRCGLKKCSYPFDWIMMADPCKCIIDCIEDDFKIFLNKSYYRSISENQCGHSLYGDSLWWHHNPLNNINTYNYYIRCVNRFKNLINSKEHKLFIMIFINGEHDSHSEDHSDKMIEFNNKFSNYTSNYTLLIIIHYPNETNRRHNFIYNNNIHFLKLHTLSGSHGSGFENNEDENYLNNIIQSAYNFNIKPV